MYSYLQSTAFLMVTEHFYIPYILVSIPGLIFVFSILLFLFVSASEGTYVYISLPLVATLCVFQDLPQYCMKSTVDTQLLNSHQEHTAAIYISVCVMWHKGTSVYISYCQLQPVTQPHCNMLHSHQQHTAAIYISVCVMWHKGTSVYISHCQLQPVTQPQFKPN